MTDAVAVIGAGNVGCALAGDLALRGFEVRLFNPKLRVKNGC
ncbi:MAG: hypothetical protein WBP81_18895 [Solirubrobacteraceae bacterium]